MNITIVGEPQSEGSYREPASNFSPSSLATMQATTLVFEGDTYAQAALYAARVLSQHSVHPNVTEIKLVLRK